MHQTKIQQHIIKVIGLLGDSSVLEKTLRNSDFTELSGPGKEALTSTEINEFAYYRDNFYPDFRNTMFVKTSRAATTRFTKDYNKPVTFIRQGKELSILVKEVTVFLFKGHIGLFAISFALPENCQTIGYLSEISLVIKNFDSLLVQQLKWHEWISQHLLNGIPLRGLTVKADEYSGSKLKLYTVIDLAENVPSREQLLFDLATSSPLGSGSGEGLWAPSPVYYQTLLKEKIAPFNNWEALCLFDSFTCIGNGQLNGLNYSTWELTYCRIYLFQLFFKYNLYRYNSDIHDAPVKLRNDFEQFLSTYKMSHISFNFLPNEIFEKIGRSLDINNELKAFEQRITQLSSKIQEEKQSKTNTLLQIVSVLTAISSAEPAIDFLQKIHVQLGWSNLQFYGTLTGILLLIAAALVYYLYTNKVIKWLKL